MIRKLRDPLSGLTHFIAVLLAIAGLVLLIYKSAQPVKVWHIVAFSIFGAGMILLYTASTLYHWIPVSERPLRFLRKLDHTMIFILIAATYTPICLIPLRGGWGWSLFGGIWGLALAGIVLKFIWIDAPRWFSTSIYLVMGWLAIVAVWPLIKTMPAGALFWLALGGLFYSVGAIVYALKKPDPFPRLFGFHEIFHLFVMGGTFSHFWVMYKFVVGFN